MAYKELIKKAIEAKGMAYAPYSNFPVGAALLTKEGKIYKGCNIESASYGASNCAERTAVFKAVSEGDRNIEAIAIISDSGDYTYPCGICRQVIVEFGKAIKIIVGKSQEEYKIYTIEELLPNSFTSRNLKTNREGATMSFKSGFATIIGRPNVGKSTLMNEIIGEKIAITSNKPQTTRNKIQCVYTQDDFQIVFLDTPGIHRPKHKLGEYMVKVAKEALREVDVILFVVEDGDSIGPGDKHIMDQLEGIKTPIILVINKIDKMNQEQLSSLYDQYEETGLFKFIIGVSALEAANLDNLIKLIYSYLPEGPKYFPDDMITDQPERIIVSEIIREKILHYTEQEIPHGVAVETTMMKKRQDKNIVDIHATIYCERKSHKGIIIGKGGRKLKGIGKSAREDMENLLGSKVYLELWVKVKEDWRNSHNTLKNLGYD